MVREFQTNLSPVWREELLAQLGEVGRLGVPLLVVAQHALDEETLDPGSAVDLQGPLLGLSAVGAGQDGGAHGLVLVVGPAPITLPQLLLGHEELLDGDPG